EAAATTAKYLASPEGPRIGALAFNGWDTHINERCPRHARFSVRGPRWRQWGDEEQSRPRLARDCDRAPHRVRTARRSVVGLRSRFSSRSVSLRSGQSAMTRPPLSAPPTRIATVPVPWSVPSLPLMRAVRPNKGILKEHLRVDEHVPPTLWNPRTDR